MERHESIKLLVLQLLEDSPLVSAEVIADVRHLVAVGEEDLAFRTMCSWIYEDDLKISGEYYNRLVEAAGALGDVSSMEKMDELLE